MPARTKSYLHRGTFSPTVAPMSPSMSNKSSSSADSSPSASFSSPRNAASYDSRPAPRRQHSYTHVFPANPSPARNKPRNTALNTGTDMKQQRGSNARTNIQLDYSDRTRQFYSGLDWLLEATSSSRGPMMAKPDFGTPLTEDALSFNARRKDSRIITKVNSEESRSSD